MLHRSRNLFGAVAAFLFATAIVYAPRIAVACSVCTSGREEENQMAFLLTTVFMSVLPLAVIGTLGFLLWRRIQSIEAESEAAPPPGASSSPNR